MLSPESNFDFAVKPEKSCFQPLASLLSHQNPYMQLMTLCWAIEILCIASSHIIRSSIHRILCIILVAEIVITIKRKKRELQQWPTKVSSQMWLWPYKTTALGQTLKKSSPTGRHLWKTMCLLVTTSAITGDIDSCILSSWNKKE